MFVYNQIKCTLFVGDFAIVSREYLQDGGLCLMHKIKWGITKEIVRAKSVLCGNLKFGRLQS